MFIFFKILLKQFFRRFLENEIIQSSSIQWKRMVFFKFIELYQKRTANTDILGKILQYIILPCFSMCYKKGEKQQLLCTLGKIDENIIGVVLNKVSISFLKNSKLNNIFTLNMFMHKYYVC